MVAWASVATSRRDETCRSAAGTGWPSRRASAASAGKATSTHIAATRHGRMSRMTHSPKSPPMAFYKGIRRTGQRVNEDGLPRRSAGRLLESMVQGLLDLGDLVAQQEVDDAEDGAAGVALEHAARVVADHHLGFDELRAFAVRTNWRHGSLLGARPSSRSARRLE